MPPVPPGLSEWLQQGLPTKAKPIDELRANMKEGFAQCRADNKALADKLDRLAERKASWPTSSFRGSRS